jgi:hypothetical protein
MATIQSGQKPKNMYKIRGKRYCTPPSIECSQVTGHSKKKPKKNMDAKGKRLRLHRYGKLNVL